MGYKIFIFILIISILSTGCSAVNYSTEPDNFQRDYSSFNKYGGNHNSIIFLLDGEKYTTNYVNVVGDSLHFLLNRDTLSIPISSVKNVIMKKWGKGIFIGLAAGLATTLVIGYAVVQLNGPGLGGALLGAGSGLLAGIVSSILGVIYGSDSNFIFNDNLSYEKIEYYKNYHKKKVRQDSTNIGN